MGDELVQYSDGGNEVTVEEIMRYDDATQMIHCQWFHSKDGARDFKTMNHTMFCFYPREIDYIVQSMGFRIKAKYGDFSGKPFGSGDLKQILVMEVELMNLAL